MYIKHALMIIIVCIMYIVGCRQYSQNYFNMIFIPCPQQISERALFFATEYKNRETIYEWGGRDGLRAIKIDCSGLIVRCYRYAISETNEYLLPFENATVKTLFEQHSIMTKYPTAGDLIFMGEPESSRPTHIALYIKEENDRIYFIDSTQKEAEHGKPAVNGVSERVYHKNDKRFKGFAKMKLMKKS